MGKLVGRVNDQASQLFGSSRQLAMGPVAMASLLVASGVRPIAGDDPVLYAALAAVLASPCSRPLS